MQELTGNIPVMLRSDEQISYYLWIITLCEENDVAIRAQDAPALAAFAINLSLLDECAASIAKEGMMMMDMQGDRNKISKVNPAIALQKEAQTALRFYFKEFQMSPTSRGGNSGLQLPPKGDKGDGFDKL